MAFWDTRTDVEVIGARGHMAICGLDDLSVEPLNDPVVRGHGPCKPEADKSGISDGGPPVPRNPCRQETAKVPTVVVGPLRKPRVAQGAVLLPEPQVA